MPLTPANTHCPDCVWFRFVNPLLTSGELVEPCGLSVVMPAYNERTTIEEIIRRVGGVVEYQVRVNRSRALPELEVTVEPGADGAEAASLASRLEHAFESSLALRVPVTLAAVGSLPRFESKARRWRRD